MSTNAARRLPARTWLVGRVGLAGVSAVLAASAVAGAASLAGCTKSATGPQPSPSPAPSGSPAAASATADGAKEGAELIGRAMPEWTLTEWRNSPPLTQAGLAGKVVLVRWFMSPSCPFCSATAPSLKGLHAKYKDQGLVVIGAYSHKDEVPLTPAHFDGVVKAHGFDFPVAIDPDWKTLKQWWLDGHERRWTSVSFVLDRKSNVRFIHPGGKYGPDSDDFKAIDEVIAQLTAEK